MTEITDLRALLEVYGIDDTEYTDTQLEIILNQAKTYIGKEFVEGSTHEDYLRIYEGSVYMTNYYPIDVETVEIIVEGVEVTPRKITHEGIIYFEDVLHGELSCSYTQELSDEDIESTVLPLAMYLIRDQNGGGTMSSIHEGDLQISYDTTTSLSTNAQIHHLVQSLRDKYKARVRLL